MGPHTFSSSTRRLDSRLPSLDVWRKASHTVQYSASLLIGSQEGNKILKKSAAWDVWKRDRMSRHRQLTAYLPRYFPPICTIHCQCIVLTPDVIFIVRRVGCRILRCYYMHFRPREPPICGAVSLVCGQQQVLFWYLLATSWISKNLKHCRPLQKSHQIP